MGPIELTFMAVVGGLSLAEFVDMAANKDQDDLDNINGDGGNGQDSNQLRVVEDDGSITYDARNGAADGFATSLAVDESDADADIKVIGGANNDYAFTGDGNDSFRMGKGEDTVSTGGGDDTVRLEDGNDALWAAYNGENADGTVKAYGGHGDDTLSSHDGEATFYGGNDHDVLIAVDSANEGDGDDLLYGGYGNDWIEGDDGDIMYGGNGGQDVFVVIPHSADDDPVMIKDFGLFDARVDGEAAKDGHDERVRIGP